MVLPPSLGDTKGHYRVHLVGNSGKSRYTVGKQLAALLGVPFIALDSLCWRPGWQKSTRDEMRQKLEQALTEAANGWVVDGNYRSRIGTIVEDNCTDVIWLDPPLLLYLPRIVIRSVLRMLRLREPCSPGCHENFSTVFFSQESIIWWCITNHRPMRRRQAALLEKIGVTTERTADGRKMRRIGGWGGELRMWLDGVQGMLQRK
ncbi:hypothetical protein B0H19DRAFT_946437 [Mycena capillaripes]|nr:hypothetical protein B0H19DRAFT_946437 [Mycena capillaripes]